MPSFKCSDIGMNCRFEATAKTKEELMDRIMEHAKNAHDMDMTSPEDVMKVDNAITE
ncbi:DUF1059 domain-containing protein [archaeon]|nr:MAG: DUF1059 domain-containing protein [archaeon]